MIIRSVLLPTKICYNNSENSTVEADIYITDITETLLKGVMIKDNIVMQCTIALKDIVVGLDTKTADDIVEKMESEKETVNTCGDCKNFMYEDIYREGMCTVDYSHFPPDTAACEKWEGKVQND